MPGIGCPFLSESALCVKIGQETMTQEIETLIVGGLTAYQGLFFAGLPWLYKNKSGLLLGVGEDAGYIASVIAANGQRHSNP